jgi:hypothetical protein
MHDVSTVEEAVATEIAKTPDWAIRCPYCQSLQSRATEGHSQ